MFSWISIPKTFCLFQELIDFRQLGQIWQRKGREPSLACFAALPFLRVCKFLCKQSANFPSHTTHLCMKEETKAPKNLAKPNSTLKSNDRFHIAFEIYAFFVIFILGSLKQNFNKVKQWKSIKIFPNWNFWHSPIFLANNLPIILSSAGWVSLVPARFLALQTNQPASLFCTAWMTRLPGPAATHHLSNARNLLSDTTSISYLHSSAPAPCYTADTAAGRNILKANNYNRQKNQEVFLS